MRPDASLGPTALAAGAAESGPGPGAPAEHVAGIRLRRDGDASPPAAGAESPSPAISPAPGPATARCAALATATTVLAILFRFGYSFGLYDQTVYSVRGIALADPGAFARDWFAQTVPQPHWLFDAATYVGARLGILPWVYLAYWLAGVAVFALASVWLVDRFLPGRRAFSLALGPLVVLGPTVVLGSTTPLLWFADPHMLGGCLAVLALAAILSGHWRSAAVAALLAEAVHVQHGANLAPVLLLAAVLGTQASRRHRILLAGTGVALVIGAPLIAQWRGLQTGGHEWLTTCRDIIPFHCYAPSWSWAYLGSGAVVLGLAFGLAWWARREWRTVVPTVVLPAAGLLLGVVGERYQLGAIGRLAEQYNIHRLATFVEPMAALALLCLVARATASGRARPGPVTTAPGQPRGTGLVGAALGALALWVVIIDGAGHGHITAGAATTGALTLALLALVAGRRDGAFLRTPGSGRYRRPVTAAAVGTLTLTVVAGAAGALGHVGYNRSLGRVQTGLALRAALPADALIIAPPELFWLRPLSQRSVIADCKAVPYGGAPWHEWMTRIEALGGPCQGTGSTFGDLRPADIEALRARYGATDVLLFDDDPKLAYARAHWTQVYEAPPPSDGSIAKGVIVFDMRQTR